jgi:hypothetical protein
MVPRRATIAAVWGLALASAVGFAACNDEKQGVDEPAREGLALELNGVEYNVFITRELNIDIPPDKAYYSGSPPSKDEVLEGIFIQACNRTDKEQHSTDSFTVKDSQDAVYEPETLPSDNPFAYHPRTLQPDECIPEAGSVAQLGPTAGSLLLFRLPLTTIENRPLELEVEAPPAGKLTFELDL